jgi:ABC-2 type transport system ATP-binding protein
VAPEPEHVPAEPVLAPEPESELLPTAEPESERELALEPETAGEPEPQPVASPESDAAAVPSPGAEPLAEPAVEPALELRREPDPDLDPEPGPERAAAVSAPAVTAERGAPADASDRTEATADDAGEEPALRVSGLRKSFGATTAVGGIDLVVPAGSFYGLVGPNGAGKTTTLSMIAGLLRPDAGSIRIAGLDARAKSRQAKRLVGVLPDRLRTFDRLTGRQLLSYSGLLRGLSSSTVESRVADLGRAFDLTQALGRPVSDYSAGMTKKVMLAGAMIHSPRLLVLDEPFEAVDPVSSAVILDILSTYVEHGGTVLLSSHGMELVERVCTRVAVMVAGQVLAAGTVDEVRGQRTLEERFLELIGGSNEVEGLEWLHTFSD